MSSDSRRTILSLEDTNLDRRSFMQIAAVLGAPAVAGCAGNDDDDAEANNDDNDSGAQTQPAEEGGKLVSTLEGDVDNLDPAYTSLSVVFVVTSQVIESLFRFNENLELQEELATNIEPQDDGSTWVVELREGVQYHQPYQREFVAEDVVANFERRLDPDAGTVWKTAVSAIDTVTAIDDYTVEFDMGDPFTTQDGLFAKANGSFIVSPDALEDNDGELRSNPVGTGPFKFEEWITGDRIRLSRFDDYWQDGTPKLDELVFRRFEEPSVMVTEIQNEEIDIIRDVPGDFVSQLDTVDTVNIETAPAQSVRMVMFNTTDVNNEGRAEGLPTTDINIRRAISELIDRNDMVELIANGYGEPAQQHYTEETPWYIDYEPHSTDANVDRARELIEESDFEAPVDIRIMSNSGDPVLQSIGRVVEDMLSDAGFNPELTEHETGTWAEKMFDLEYDITPNYQGSLTIPDGLRIWYHSEDSVTNHYANERVTELFDLANSTTDEEQRIEYYAELQHILADELPNCFLFHPQWVHAYSDAVNGYNVATDRTQMNLRDVTVSR